jgi:hypothetical protein
VLRTLGKQAEDACELLLASELEAISTFAATLPLTKASLKSPWPDRHRAKPKPRIRKELVPTGPFAARLEAEKRKRREKARLKKEAAIANAVTPEQAAMNKPSVKVFKDGRWVDDAMDGT